MKLPLNNHKVRLYIAGIMALLVGALPFPALAQRAIAQSDELKSALDDVSQSVIQLDNTTEARHEALNKIFDLTIAEVKDLSEKTLLTQALIESDEDIADRANFHLNILQSYEAYINNLKLQVAGAEVSLEMLQNKAVEFKQWRATVYEPATKEIFDFLLLLQARAVLATAENRLSLIAADVKKLSLRATAPDANSLKQLLAGAQKNLTRAKNYQEAGRVEFFKGEIDTFKKAIRDEFSTISLTYTKYFFPMSKIAQKY